VAVLPTVVVRLVAFGEERVLGLPLRMGNLRVEVELLSLSSRAQTVVALDRGVLTHAFSAPSRTESPDRRGPFVHFTLRRTRMGGDRADHQHFD
jgi:hypothetical protein